MERRPLSPATMLQTTGGETRWPARKLWGNDDPLFPATAVVNGASLKFEAALSKPLTPLPNARIANNCQIAVLLVLRLTTLSNVLSAAWASMSCPSGRFRFLMISACRLGDTSP